MGTEISLNAARSRVSRMVGVDAPWTPRDIRWIAGHWRIFNHELRLCEALKGEIMELELDSIPTWVLALRALRSGMTWWLQESSILARSVVAFASLFAFGLGLGLGLF